MTDPLADTSKMSLQDMYRELERRKYDDPLGLVYQPHEGQLKAHRARGNTTVVLGGNRAGKSWFAVAEALTYCLGRRTYAEVPDPPVVVWYVMPSLPMFRRTVLPIFRRLMPKAYIESWSEHKHVARFKNGSELHFLSADMRQRRLQGASVDLVIMDETPDETVFEEMQARVLDRQGRLLLVFAPIDAASFWVRDKLFIPWQAGDRQDVQFVFMPVADREGNPLVPHFTKEDIARMERQWPDPAIREARMYGHFVTRAGQVIRGYDPEIHHVPRFQVPDTFSRWFLCDPQYHRFGSLFFAADDAGNYFVTDEYFSQEENLAERATRLAVIAGKDTDRAIPVYVDSANPQDIAELNWHFNRIGAPLGAVRIPFAKRVEDMILRTHSMLEPDPEREFPKILQRAFPARYKKLYGSPRLFFFDDLMSTWEWEGRPMQCSRLLWEIQRYAWGKDQRPDKKSADGADCVDCLVYGCSITSTGTRLEEADAWMKNLSTSDVMLWKAIERHDAAQRRVREW